MPRLIWYFCQRWEIQEVKSLVFLLCRASCGFLSAKARYFWRSVSCWFSRQLAGFVLSHSSNEMRSRTFVMASKMARGLLFSLAIPVFTYLYHCFNRVVASSTPGEKAIYEPFQYFFGWVSLYFPKTYSHDNPSNDKPIPYLGLIGNQTTGDFHLTKSPYAQQFLVFSRTTIIWDLLLTMMSRREGSKTITKFLISYLAI